MDAKLKKIVMLGIALVILAASFVVIYIRVSNAQEDAPGKQVRVAVGVPENSHTSEAKKYLEKRKKELQSTMSKEDLEEYWPTFESNYWANYRKTHGDCPICFPKTSPEPAK